MNDEGLFFGGWKVVVKTSTGSRHELAQTGTTQPAPAERIDHYPGSSDDDCWFRVAVSAPGDTMPSLVVTASYESAAGFSPGVLVAPETSHVFIGARTSVLCYQRRKSGWGRDWQRFVEVGFWRWDRHNDVVLMQAELELAAWALDGRPLWSARVEPPWDYAVSEDVVRLEVVGRVSTFPLRAGPGPRSLG